MAWTSPRTWVAAEVLTAALMNVHVRDNEKVLGDAWTSYTPALTNWTLGNGTLTGATRIVGKTVDFRIDLVLGSTSTMVGTFFVSLPSTGIAGASTIPVLGSALINDVSAGLIQYWQPVFTGVAGLVSARNPVTGTQFVGANVPWTWANTDKIHIVGQYESV